MLAALFGTLLGCINAFLIFQFRIVSIVVTIATYNLFFGLLMFFSGGVSLYDLPDWWVGRLALLGVDTGAGRAELTLPVAVMAVCVAATWFLLRRTSTGRQLYAMGDNAEAARRLGIGIGAMHYLAFGWLGLMAGIAGLMQAHYAQEVVPNALYGRELDVLAAVVLGGARLGGGPRHRCLGVILGIVLVAVTQNGLNLLGISPYAFKMIIGAIILVAITLSSEGASRLFGAWRSPVRPRGRLMSSPSVSGRAGRPVSRGSSAARSSAFSASSPSWWRCSASRRTPSCRTAPSRRSRSSFPNSAC